MANRRYAVLALMLLIALIVSACNLSGAPSEEQIAQTASAVVTGTGQPTRTPLTTSGVPTTIPLTRPTNLPTFSFPTAIVSVPTRISTSAPPPVIIPTIPQQQQPVSIVILSPVSGNVVAGNVSIIGSATHPQFLQYQVEFGPDPNPGNLWFPATNAVTTPVQNGLLGVWNTNSVQDSRYQLRLRVYLRDGTLLTTVINNIIVQNRVSTPVPSPTPNIPRPIAAFTQDRTGGDVPLTVQFTNQSSGTINSLSWNFGDGNTSSEIHPRHTFGAPGLYTVTLTVNGPGGSSNVARQINVTSPTAPVAGFIMDRNTGLAPLTVQFTDQSVGNITSFQWFFSDGSTSALRNPSHTFTTPGTYNIFLTVSGPGGASSATRQLAVTVLVSPTFTPSLTFTPTFTPSFTPTLTETPTNTTTVVPPTLTFTPSATSTEVIPLPVAFFTVSGVPGNPLTIQFTNASTGVITAYLWDFGDGMTSADVNPQHTYASAGTYTVKLTVTDVQGRQSSHSVTGTITPPTNTATSTETPTNTTTVVPPTSTETPTNTSVPPTATFTETPTNTSVPPTATFTEMPTETPVPPTETFTPTATNTEFPAPQASFIANAVPENPLAVQFTNTSTGEIIGYSWDFGDGTGSTEFSPSHIYGSGGTYNVTLIATDSLGRASNFVQQVAVSEPITAAFSANAADLSVQFASQSTGPVTGYAWDFGDGTFSNEQNPLHPYAQGGTYNVTLVVSSSDGRTDTETQQVSVSAPVQAGFAAQPSDLTVQFIDQSTGPIASYAWDFGDGTGSSEASPLHPYGQGGTYNVTLTVTGTDGRTDTETQQVAVDAPIQANFSAQPNNLDVQFVDQSTGPVTGYAWDFGDGASSSDSNPLHSYAQGGTYNVTLMVSNASGVTNSTTQQVAVATPVQAAFTAQATDLSVQFTNQSSGDIAQFNWSFGDGGTSTDPNPLYTYAAPGSYTVTLIVTSNNGTSDDQSQVVEVTSPLAANFAAEPTDLNVQFTDQSSGQITQYAWDFGDGTFSNEQNPLHSYPTDGTYTVTLTVTDAGGRTAQSSSEVTVSAPIAQPTEPPVEVPGDSLVDTTPILPDFNTLRDGLRNVYASGVNSFGNRAGVFAVAGDSIFTENEILTPFALNGVYDLGGNDDLKPIIDWFNFVDLGGVTSFNRSSLAINPNWTAADLLDPGQADPSCNGEAPLPCELHQTLPVLMLVSIGENDAQAGTDPATFQNTLNQIVSVIIANGTIPVLITVPDDGSSPNTVAINEAIIGVAQANNLPLLNVARALAQRPDANLDASPTGAGDLGSDAINNYGINAVNFGLLRILSDARNIVFPDA